MALQRPANSGGARPFKEDEMVALRRKKAGFGVRAGLLAGVFAALAVIGGIGASGAVAAPACPENAVQDIEGKGSWLQRLAQQPWTGRVVPINAVPAFPPAHEEIGPAVGYAKVCAQPTVSYTATSDESALLAFRFIGAGKIENGAAGGHTMAFTGVDLAPNAVQITNAQIATTGAKALTIPVAQTSIAVVVHPPALCTLKFDKTHGITYKQLTQLWGGKEVVRWEQLTTAEPVGAGCKEPIVRVVPSEADGVTYQFKNYLAALKANGGVGMPCSLTGFNEITETEEATAEWAKMKAIRVKESGPNGVWPEKVNCAEPAMTTVERKAGGAAVAEYVAATAGTIGYAALADAKSTAASVAWLQNKSAEGVTYAAPGVEGEEGGVKFKRPNCGARRYIVPVAGQVGNSGESADWSQVFGAVPTVGATLYPLCGLTYDLSWTKYEKAGYKNPAAIAADVKDYLLNWVLGGAPVPQWYQSLPVTELPANNVFGAALLAAGKIG
jgi:ABC-type phosphate transport system substrate-binding protein